MEAPKYEPSTNNHLDYNQKSGNETTDHPTDQPIPSGTMESSYQEKPSDDFSSDVEVGNQFPATPNAAITFILDKFDEDMLKAKAKTKTGYTSDHLSGPDEITTQVPAKLNHPPVGNALDGGEDDQMKAMANTEYSSNHPAVFYDEHDAKAKTDYTSSRPSIASALDEGNDQEISPDHLFGVAEEAHGFLAIANCPAVAHALAGGVDDLVKAKAKTGYSSDHPALAYAWHEHGKANFSDQMVEQPSAALPTPPPPPPAILTRCPQLQARPGAYHRQPGGGEHRREAFHAEQLSASGDGLQLDIELQQESTERDPTQVLSSLDMSSPPMSTSGLVEAQPVSENFTTSLLHVAVPADLAQMEEIETKRRQFNRACLLGGIGSLLAMVVIAVGVVYGTQSSKSEEDHEAIMTDPASTAPTMAQTSLLLDLPNYTVESIMRYNTSAQAKAYNWIINDPNFTEYPHDRKLQRFALATFFYSTGGESWTENGTGTNGIPIICQGASGDNSRMAGSSNSSSGASGNMTAGASMTFQEFMMQRPSFCNIEAWMDYSTHECNWYIPVSMNPRGSCNHDGIYKSLDMSKNDLVGNLPPELSLLSHLFIVNLRENKLKGTLPTQIFHSWKTIVKVFLQENELSGTIPTEIGLWNGSIDTIHGGVNSFQGTLPTELGELTRLVILEFPNNLLSGTFLHDIGHGLPMLEALVLSDNSFTMDIPTEIGLMKTLHILDMSINQLTSVIPSEVGQLTLLRRLKISSNHISGTLPSQLGQLLSLGIFDVENNLNLVGTIPSEMGALVIPKNQTLSSEVNVSLGSGMGSVGDRPPGCDEPPGGGGPPGPSGLPSGGFAGGGRNDCGDSKGLITLKLSITGLNGTIPSQLCQVEDFSLDCISLCGCDCTCQ